MERDMGRMPSLRPHPVSLRKVKRLQRVLFVTREYPGTAEGGISRRLSRVIPGLMNLGVHVGVVTFSDSSIAGERIYPLKATSKILYTHAGEPGASDFASIINDIWRLNRYTNEISNSGGYDIIQIEEPIFGPFIDGSLPKVVTVHNTQACVAMAYLRSQTSFRQMRRSIFSGTVGYGFDYMCLRACDCVIAVSPSVKDEIERYYHIPSAKVELIPSGLDVPPPPISSKNDSDNLLTFINVGRLVDVKRVDILLKALRRLKATGRTGFRCFIVGTGPSESNLHSLVVRLSLEKEVSFTGYISDEALDALFSSADVVVSPSDYETWGLTVFEGAGHGCAPVVSRIPAFASNFTDGVNSLQFEPGSESDLAEKLGALYDDEGLLERIQVGARSLALGMDWDTSVEKLVKLYSSLGDEHGRRE
jgi:glycosyltransferase involved in cell wall biosynthesis